MESVKPHRIPGIWIVLTGLLELMLSPATALAQSDEAASRLIRYRLGEMSTGYYEEHEVIPRHQLPLASSFEVRRQQPRLPSSTSPVIVRIRTRLADSHQGIKFYQTKQCEVCHVEQTHGMHTVRAKLTCRQCHGLEPIASINHHFSPMNSIRRHSAVCAKCHPGASESFATYVIHEPLPSSSTARNSFPSLYYAYWLMLILFVGTLGFFIPHSLLVAARELFGKRRQPEEGSSNEHQTI